MNERIATIKTRYYTCYECLGQKPLHLTTAFLSFFYREKKIIQTKKGGAEILINTSQEISLRYTNKLNRSSYSSLGVSRSMMLAEEEGAGRLSNPMGFP
jgi:hypothetical protein